MENVEDEIKERPDVTAPAVAKNIGQALDKVEKKPFPNSQPKYATMFGLGEDLCVLTYESITKTFTFALNHKYFTRISKHNLGFLGERLQQTEMFNADEIKCIRGKMSAFKEELWNKGILN